MSNRKGPVKRGGSSGDAPRQHRSSGPDKSSTTSRDRPQSKQPDEGTGGHLPRWVIEALSRVTPQERVPAALRELGDATDALAEGRFQSAWRHASKAKELSPRDISVREVLGLSAYRLGEWVVALRELRTHRRLSGEVTHLPVEMDSLRAMGRNEDVEKLWQEVGRLADEPSIIKEASVVYASYLLDNDRTEEARALITPGRLSNKPYPEDLRVWYVAARSAALDGDPAEANRIRDAIEIFDPAFPGLDLLAAEISPTA